MSKPVIWVTGASSGIGEATALKFAQQGYRVILSARNKAALQSVKAKAANPEFCAVLPLDLAKSEQFEDKVKQAISFFGQIDIMFHNGGISQRSLVRETGIEVDRRLMEVNFFGTVALTKALLPHFIERKSGHFAVITSLVGKFGSPYRSAYAASKHALHGFFDSLRAEEYKETIAVTMICPGFIRTQVSVNAITGDGTPLNFMDEAQANGMSAEKCADQIFSALRKRKEEVYIGGKETLAVYIKRLFPSVFSKILRKVKVR
jgi:short-subunit dehydrogenase